MEDSTETTKNNESVIALLHDCLSQHFGVSDSKFQKFIEKNCEYIDLHTGDVLLEQGENSDDVYFLLTGRMRAMIAGPNGNQITIGEIGRGETVGELAMFTGQRRTASVMAIRDSLAAKVSRQTLEKAIGKQPVIAMAITKQVIDRFRSMDQVSKPPRVPVSLTFLPITDGIDIRDFVHRQADIRRSKGDNVIVIDDDYIHENLGPLTGPDISLPRGPVSIGLGELELRHDAVYHIGNPADMAWCHTAVHHSDEVVLVANADADPEFTDLEALLFPGDVTTRANMTLVLLQKPDIQCPKGTAQWLAPRSVSRHQHIRIGSEKDHKRLSRILSGRAIGLVMAGGGARGIAHLGVVNALFNQGIEFDFIGGTSAGAIMGSFLAMGATEDTLIKKSRGLFVDSETGNISGDYNLLPIVSILKGGRARIAARNGVMAFAGHDLDMEDAWKTFYVIASNFSTKSEQVLTHGNLAKNVLASFAIPGLMPPVILDNHLMYDGGSFNNFPVDEMRRLGAGKVIGVDLMSDAVREYDIAEVPKTRSLIRDMFRKRKTRKYKIPALPATLLSATVITSMARQKNLRKYVDLLFQPNVRGIGLLDWKKYDALVQSSKSEALEQLAGTNEALLNQLRD